MQRTTNLVRSLAVLVAAALIGTLPPALAEHAADARFRELVPWLPKGLPPVDEVVAFEEHAHFVYLAGRLSDSNRPGVGANDHAPRLRFILLRPGALVVDIRPFDPKQHAIHEADAPAKIEFPARAGNTSQRRVCIYPSHAGHRLTADARPDDDDTWHITVRAANRRFHLVLPPHGGDSARIGIKSSDGNEILAPRRLPDGVLPLGTKGMRLLENWDSRYRGNSRPPWDKGFPSSHLKAALENGRFKPGRAVVLGCGTGTNAILLAQKGFDVTAIDVAPTALNLAEQKAKTAGVKVRWLLADVLAPPADLKPFDFIFDRGCYHGVRRGNARGYVEAVKRLSQPGTQILILAGNANEERHYGPPRVKEEELRDDFSSNFDFVRLDTVHFDSIDPDSKGALAWSVLLRRKADRQR
jgi:SAM-dependent methyltransferase